MPALPLPKVVAPSKPCARKAIARACEGPIFAALCIGINDYIALIVTREDKEGSGDGTRWQVGYVSSIVKI